MNLRTCSKLVFPNHRMAQYFQRPYPGPIPDYPGNYYSSSPPQQYFAISEGKSQYQDELYRPQKKINDPIFLILFVLQFLGFAGISVIVILDWVKRGGTGAGLGKPGTKNELHITLNEDTIFLLLLVTAAALLLSIAYMILTRIFTRAVMHVTLVLSILLNVALCAFFWITKVYIAAVVFTIIALLSVFSYWGMKKFIPFSSLLLQVVMDVSKHHMSVFVVAFVALIAQAAMAVWFTFTAIATYIKFTPGTPACSTDPSSCSTGKVIGLVVFELISFMWTSQVIGNVALSTVAGGPYGTWYYFGPKNQGQMPNHPTLSAFGRAMSVSLGSIAFGSLIVTLLEVIRMVLNAVENNASADGHPVEMCLACCASCFVGILESMVEYFNKYAYIEIALFGKAYIPAAKDTWRMFKDRGMTALINDSLVSMTMLWGAYAVGCLSSLLAFLYLRITAPAYNTSGDYTIPVVVFAFLIAVMCSLTMTSSIDAGVSTIFVGLGTDPQVLAERAPVLFNMIAEHYPEVVRPVV
ncbi:DUF580-domain-containing protein [Pluteus cervinus]|uniref:DUF580-domain-containing protein n=1 Tax=Pluteus cervinus TaxID=181527 RepID=A0ACD3BBJ2_9AGAR|nr:DUF580-domain-containing protein [Pluteus cervinus]